MPPIVCPILALKTTFPKTTSRKCFSRIFSLSRLLSHIHSHPGCRRVSHHCRRDPMLAARQALTITFGNPRIQLRIDSMHPLSKKKRKKVASDARCHFITISFLGMLLLLGRLLLLDRLRLIGRLLLLDRLLLLGRLATCRQVATSRQRILFF